MNPLRRPRLWATLVVCAAIGVSAWLMLVPRTAVYLKELSASAPYRVSSVYSWWTSDQDLVFSDTGMSPVGHPVNGVRLDCGSSFTTGPHEQARQPDGPQACAAIETPRTVVGLILLTLGAFGVPIARRLPPTTGPSRYTMSYQQRRALRRSR